LRSISFKTKPGKDTTAPFKVPEERQDQPAGGRDEGNGCKGDLVVAGRLAT
jgi:hypothetical protein